MTADFNSNVVYLASCLFNKHPLFAVELSDIFAKNKVHWNIIHDTKEIWCRDYMPIQIDKDKFIKFRYNLDLTDGLDKRLDTDENVCKICDELGVGYTQSDIFLDGGNCVISENSVIFTDKIFSENKDINSNELVIKLKQLFNRKVVIIPQEPYDPLGHADGMIKFKNNDTVILNKYPNSESYNNIRRTLREYDFNIELFPYGAEYKQQDAFGYYINYLQLSNFILIPRFTDEKDDLAVLKAKELFPNHSVESISCIDISELGGVLNCITWAINL
jgi:agmatine deiminase